MFLTVCSQDACGKACGKLNQAGCCYWKPKDRLCKFFYGATGDPAGAGGRYQAIFKKTSGADLSVDQIGNV